MPDPPLTRILTNIIGRYLAIPGTRNTYQLPPSRHVTILELEDVLFHHNSAVILPVGPEGPSAADGEGPTAEQLQISGLTVLAAVLRLVAANPCKRLLIAGHTDTSGGIRYNLELSEKRGLSAFYLLNGQRQSWAEMVEEQSKVSDYQAVLEYMTIVWGWDCDPEGVDNIRGPKTRRAVRGFQRRYNADFIQSIAEDSIVGEDTWGAIFDVYRRDIARLVGTSVSGLSDWQDYIVFADPMMPVMPCGEHIQLEEIGRDGYRSQQNRRVEFVFFDEEEIPESGLFIRSPSPENKFWIYDPSYFERDYVDPADVLGAETVRVSVEYLPDAALSTPLTLKEDPGGTEIASPDEILTKDWRVVFTDNHMLPDGNDLLGRGGQNQSIPDFYNGRGWNPTSTPVLPLKMTVTKGSGNSSDPIGAGAVTLAAQLLVEPVETAALVPASEKTFIETVFQRHAYTHPTDAEINANNAPITMAGVRPDGTFQTAADRFATFDGENQTTAVMLTEFEDGGRQALIHVPASNVVDCKNESIVNLLVYLPQQTGERYRLRFHILGQATDNQVNSQILTVWRRLRIELVVNIGTALSNAIMSDVQEAYEQVFIELTEPEKTTTLTSREWRDITRAYMVNAGIAGAGDLTKYQYDVNLLPTIDEDDVGDAFLHAMNVSQLYRTRGLAKAGIAAPTGNIIVYGPPIHPSESTLGFYAGDSLSAFFRGRTTRSTFVHEIGHGRFLRHSFTRPVTDEPRFNGRLIYGTSNRRFWRDHNQLFGGGCTMSYTRDRTIYHFCGMCQLILRFWDKVELRRAMQDVLDAGWGPLTIVTNRYNAINIAPPLKRGLRSRLRVLAGPDSSGSGTYYKDVTRHGVIRWNATPAGIVSIAAATGRVTGVTNGTATITARIGTTVSPPVQIRVTDP